MKVPIYIREDSGGTVVACCPLIPGLCVRGSSIEEAMKDIRRCVRQAILSDPSVHQGAHVTMMHIDVLEDEDTAARDPRSGP